VTAAIPAERVAEILIGAGYRRLGSPLQVAGLTFDVAGAFVGSDHSADLIVVGDMATDGEKKVVQQIDGIARALDVMRSQRPLTSVIVGPRPIGKTLEALAQVSRTLSVEEATDPLDLRDRLAVLLPLDLPTALATDRDLGSDDQLVFSEDPVATDLIEASQLGEDAVRRCFHAALSDVLQSPHEAEGGSPE
jgi:hypothetical protein